MENLKSVVDIIIAGYEGYSDIAQSGQKFSTASVMKFAPILMMLPNAINGLSQALIEAKGASSSDIDNLTQYIDSKLPNASPDVQSKVKALVDIALKAASSIDDVLALVKKAAPVAKALKASALKGSFKHAGKSEEPKALEEKKTANESDKADA